MAQLELSAAEARLLGELPTYSLSELHTEISHTDNRDLHEELKEREERLRGIRDRVTALEKT